MTFMLVDSQPAQSRKALMDMNHGRRNRTSFSVYVPGEQVSWNEWVAMFEDLIQRLINPPQFVVEWLFQTWLSLKTHGLHLRHLDYTSYTTLHSNTKQRRFFNGVSSFILSPSNHHHPPIHTHSLSLSGLSNIITPPVSNIQLLSKRLSCPHTQTHTPSPLLSLSGDTHSQTVGVCLHCAPRHLTLALIHKQRRRLGVCVWFSMSCCSLKCVHAPTHTHSEVQTNQQQSLARTLLLQTQRGNYHLRPLNVTRLTSFHLLFLIIFPAGSCWVLRCHGGNKCQTSTNKRNAPHNIFTAEVD